MTNPGDLGSPRYVALIPAAGVGARMGSALPKQYLDLAGVPVLRRTVEVFAHHPLIERVYVLVSDDDGQVQNVLAGLPEKVCVLRCGGATRKDTVRNGLRAIAAAVNPHDWMLVHDAARALLTLPLIDRLIAEIAPDEVGGLLALPVVDTVKRCDEKGVATISREGLWLAQTPQMFHHAQLLLALEVEGEITDEASAIEMMGAVPKLVLGHSRNLKLTRPEDLQIAQAWLAADGVGTDRPKV